MHNHLSELVERLVDDPDQPLLRHLPTRLGKPGYIAVLRVVVEDLVHHPSLVQPVSVPGRHLVPIQNVHLGLARSSFLCEGERSCRSPLLLPHDFRWHRRGEDKDEIGDSVPFLVSEEGDVLEVPQPALESLVPRPADDTDIRIHGSPDYDGHLVELSALVRLSFVDEVVHVLDLVIGLDHGTLYSLHPEGDKI